MQTRLRSRAFIKNLVHSRQIDLKCAALSGLAVNPDITAALFHDSVDGRKSKPSAAAALFSGEKRFENVRHSLLVHAHTGIGNGEHHVPTGFYRGVLYGIACIEVGVTGFDDKASALRHRVARVDHQVHDDLLDLRGVCFHLTDIFSNARDHLDPLIHQTAQKGIEIQHDLVQIENFGLQNLFAAEGKQLAYE